MTGNRRLLRSCLRPSVPTQSRANLVPRQPTLAGSRTMTDKDVIRMNNLGAMWIKEGYYTKAVEYLHKAAECCRRHTHARSVVPRRDVHAMQQSVFGQTVHYQMVTHAPVCIHSDVQDGTVQTESLLYGHPVTVSRPLHPSVPAAYGQQRHTLLLRAVLFNLALAYHLHARQRHGSDYRQNRCGDDVNGDPRSRPEPSNGPAEHQQQQQQQQQQFQVATQQLFSKAEASYRIFLSSFGDKDDRAAPDGTYADHDAQLLQLAAETNLAHLYIMTGQDCQASCCFRRILTSRSTPATTATIPQSPTALPPLDDTPPNLQHYATFFYQNAAAWTGRDLAVTAAAA